MQQDSVRNRLTRQLDSLERNFDRIVTVMEHLPQIADYMGKSLNTEVAALIETLNGAVDNAFADLDRQRAELQGYISAERKALVDQAQQAVDAAVQMRWTGYRLWWPSSSPGSCFSPSSCWACRSASVSGWDGCANVPNQETGGA